MEQPVKAITVFCGAQPQVAAAFLDAARAFGTACAHHGVQVVYGGGDGGMMGAVADAAIQAGASVIGVFPDNLKGMERCHARLAQVYHEKGMHERKCRMYNLGDAFVILPGGFGTLDEFFEILTWRQIGLHHKPIVIYNLAGYWNPLLSTLHTIETQGFALASHATYQVATTLDEVFAMTGCPRPPL